MRAWLAAPLAALGLAAGGDGREEYTPRTHPVEADGDCRRGFAFQERLRDKAAVCVRPCRPRHLLLDDQARDRLRCVPTRRSRLWYRARLDADVRFDAGGTATGPRGDTIVTT